MTRVEDFAPRRGGVRSLEALEGHVSLVQALKRPGPEGGGRLWGAMNVDPDTQVIAHGSTEDEAVARLYGQALDSGATIVVTNRMLSVILERMGDVRFGQPLMPEDLPFPAALVVLPRPVRVLNDDHEIMATFDPDERLTGLHPRDYAEFDCCSWVPSKVLRVEDQEGRDLRAALGLSEDTNGIMYAQLVSRVLSQRLVREPDFPERAGAPEKTTVEMIELVRLAYERHRIEWMPIYSAGWAFEIPWDPDLRETSFTLTAAGEFERRFYHALWRTLKEEVIAPVHFRRGDFRRAARLRAYVPEVVVADLRKIKHRRTEESTDDGATIMWSHRWRVREHTRTYHRGQPDERTITIQSYVKGPEHLPLLDKDRVYRLSR